MSAHDLISLASALLVLVAVTVAVGRIARLDQGREVCTAALRAIVQLIAVGAVIVAVFRAPQLAAVYLAVMLVAAGTTSAHRLRGVPGAWVACLAAIAAGAGVSLAIVLLSRALPLDARTAVPLAAQLIGGAMTATTLAGQRLRDGVQDGWEEVEGWLAIGATPREAVHRLARLAAARALVPAIDQTRNVGLVVLPGAFVGLLLGGASPVVAARVQLLVLVGLMAAETVAAVVVTTMISARLGARRPSPVR